MSGASGKDIADAFAAADAAAATKATRTPADAIPFEERLDAAAAEERAAAERKGDAQSILRIYGKAKDKARALAVGRAYGWTDEQIVALVAGRAKRSAPAADPGPAGPGSGPGSPAGAPPSGDDEGGGWIKKRAPIKPLPEDCPVRPLGRQGANFYYLSPMQELLELSARDHNANGIRALFGQRQDYVWATWPKYSEATRMQTGWKVDAATESLMDAADRKGVFDAGQKVRGTGGWRSAAGELVLHCGDGVLVGGAWREPGEQEGLIYTRGEIVPRPLGRPATPADVEPLLNLLDSWHWRRDVDEDTGRAHDHDGSGHALSSILLLGLIAAGMAGAALRWRPVAWITGDAGMGKSTLIEVIQHVHGGHVLYSTDPTAAGVWSSLKNSPRPVILDEAENDPKSDRMQRLVKLAREAASGGVVLRGSSEQRSSSFQARSAFMFASIIMPPMLPQDLTRVHVLELAPLGDRKLPALARDTAGLVGVGVALRRRLVDGWPRLEEALSAYAQLLAEQGHSARGQDQYGTMLALADLMRGDELADADTRRALCRALVAEKVYVPSNAEAFLNHLLNVPLDVFRGGTRMTIGALVSIAAHVDWRPTPMGEQSNGPTPSSCAEALKAHGVFVSEPFLDAPNGLKAKTWCVTLPNQHPGLARILDDSMWRAVPGATGAWQQAMARLPRVEAENTRRDHIGRGMRVPVSVFLMLDEAAPTQAGPQS